MIINWMIRRWIIKKKENLILMITITIKKRKKENISIGNKQEIIRNKQRIIGNKK